MMGLPEPVYMLIALLGFILLGLPIPLAVTLAAGIGYLIIDVPMIALAQNMYTGLNNFALVTVPLFIFAGALMERGGLAKRIVDVSQALVGSLPGSLAIISVVACTFFGALSGSGPATTAAVGAVMIPAMVKHGYSAAFAGGVNAASGAIGSLIPPSNLMIIFGIVSSTSIPHLFLAGVLPGLLVAALLFATALFMSFRMDRVQDRQPFHFGELRASLKHGAWALAAPVIILGGIYSGIFTPTEAAAVAVVYALAVGTLVHKELTFSRLLEAMRSTALISGAIVIIVGPAKAFGEITSLSGLPIIIGDYFTAMTQSPFLFLLIVAAILIVTGTFMDSIAQIVIVTPLVLPVALDLGISPITLGVLFILACEIGFLTPPVGANLFVAAKIANVSIERISVAVLPFLLAYLAVIFIVAAVPKIATFLPDVMM